MSVATSRAIALVFFPDSVGGRGGSARKRYSCTYSKTTPQGVDRRPGQQGTRVRSERDKQTRHASGHARQSKAILAARGLDKLLRRAGGSPPCGVRRLISERLS
jgi:hypothetical protein